MVEHIGQKVNLDLQFTAESGYQVPLRQFFEKGKPVLLNLVYYRCPMLCNLRVERADRRASRVGVDRRKRVRDRDHQHRAGRSNSISRRAKKKFYLETLRQAAGAARLAFPDGLSGQHEAARREVGFQYRWDAKTEQWAHTAAIMMLTPGRTDLPVFIRRASSRSVICVWG